MFVFTLQTAMATVTMEILRSFVKHYFLIVFVAIFNQTIKKNNIKRSKKLCDYSMVFILTKSIAVYLYKASIIFFGGVGRGQGNALQSAKNALKRLFSKN